MAYKKPGQGSFTNFPATGAISQTDDQIIIDSLPIDLQVSLTDIVPKPTRATVKIKIDDKYMSEKSPTVFRTTVSDKKDHIITIIVEDEQGTTVERRLTVTLNQSIIQGVLKADVYNGTEPLTVNLDASTTKLNDETDEIIYFTWEFGDGEMAKNVSQGRISHIYTFDQKLQSGQYVPRVTVTTKKGYTSTFAIDTPISVTRQASTVQVTLPSNPTQVALVNKSVDMEMTSDGPISKISWDFGDGDTYYCNDR
ncbi:PKD domain-containing protein [Patescibacteria group bacterium]|nr:PKD domain-containing protein [Patescibacteria group bacterium]